MADAGRFEHQKLFLPWLIPALCLLGWFVVSGKGWIPDYLLPSPADIFMAGHTYIFGNLGDGPYAGRFLQDAAASLIRVSLGFILASVAGVTTGVISGRLPGAQKMLGTSINGLRAVPGICWLPLALVWFGIGIKTTIFLIGLASFFPIYLNSAAGARQINPLLYQSGAMMGVGRIRGIFTILLPAAMPHIHAGLRLGLGIAWAYLVLGELTGVPDGLGAVIMDARMQGRIDIIIVGILLIAIIGRTSDRILGLIMSGCFKSVRRMP
jgi:NitT/TauT family transport system permease protein